jgi:hypothetical protein
LSGAACSPEGELALTSSLRAPYSLRSLPEPVFRPRVGGIAIAADFPKTGPVFRDEFDAANKLCPFPGVKFRDYDAGGAAVIARDGFAIEPCGHQRVIIERIFDPHIGAIAVVAAEENVTHFRFRFHDFRKREESDATPATIEFAPSRDAVEIGHVLELREGIEVLPGKRFRVLDQSTDLEAPIGQSDFRFDPEIEDGKALGEMLARRETIGRAARTGLKIRLSGSDRPAGRRLAVVSSDFARHFARPTFLALDQTGIGRCHNGKLNRR